MTKFKTLQCGFIKSKGTILQIQKSHRIVLMPTI
ncbi:MAG: hypothetical protein RLZZ540_2091 [Bacteroidota bacterium]|jgi:hypothetical protein